MTESILSLPAQLVQRFSGLTLDFGASLIKFAYRSNEDTDESRADGKYGHVRVVTFPRRELSSALEHVRQRSVLLTTRHAADAEAERRATICTTGVGCTQHGRFIADTLNVNLQQLTEFDCVAKAFVYVADQLPRDQVLEPLADEIFEPIIQSVMNMMSMAQDSKQFDGFFSAEADMNNLDAALGRSRSTADAAVGASLSEAEPDLFPCLVIICGSAFAFLKVEKDASFKIVEMSSRAGRSFVGLCSVLAEFQTYEELLELAAGGTDRNVNQYTSDVNYASDAVEGDDSPYVAMAKRLQETPLLLFSFGKAVGSKRGDFKREDLARTVLEYISQDLVQTTRLVCRIHGIKRVFFTGGFCSSPLVRGVIASEYVRRNLSAYIQGQNAINTFDFIKHGEHLGAIGCILSDAQRSHVFLVDL